jgi:hypothetical protein
VVLSSFLIMGAVGWLLAKSHRRPAERAPCAQAADAREELLTQYCQAEALSQKGHLAEATKLYERVVARAPEVFGAGAKDTANMINNQGRAARPAQLANPFLPGHNRTRSVNRLSIPRIDCSG